MEKESKVQTGLRVSETMLEEIGNFAESFDISKNALMTIALRIGLNHLKELKQLPLSKE